MSAAASNPPAASGPPAGPAPAAAPRRRHRKLRWLLYTLGTVAILLALLICIVQIVLWSSTPRNIVMSLIEQKLGIRAGADTLSTTWFGRTTLHNFRLALPLSDEPFVQIPTIVVHHRWLTSLAVTGDIGLRSIELDQPTLTIRRDALGRWNVQDVADMIAAALGPAAMSSAGSGAVPLPAIRIVGATIHVSDASGRSTTIGPIDLYGARQSAVAWKFTATIPDHLTASGLLAPGGSWGQALDFQLRNLKPWIDPWFNRLPANAQVAGHWSGQLASTSAGPSLTGLLMLQNLTAAQLHAVGNVDASIGADAISAHPRWLTITTPAKLLPRADVVGGSVSFANGTVTAQDLALELLGGPAKVSASYNLAAGGGQLTAAWQSLGLPGGVADSGTLTASLTHPFATQLRLDATVNSTGSAPGGPFVANAMLSAGGTDWTHFTWQAQTPTLKWQRLHPIDLSGLRAAGSMRGSTLSLDSVDRPADPSLTGMGRYDFSQRDWAIRLAGQTWPFHPAEGRTFSFHLDADGNPEHATLHDFSLRQGKNFELIATGAYVYAIPKPVSLEVRVRNIPDPANPSVLGGAFSGDVHILGTVWPRQLDVLGQLHGTDLAVGTHRLGNLAVKVSGAIDDERADIRTEHLALLGGQGDLEGIYSFAADALDVGLTVRDVSVAEAGQLIGRSDCSGVAGGHWHLFLPGLSLDPRRIRLTGLIEADNAAVGNLVAADRIDAQTDLQNRILTVKPITMLYGPNGHGSGELSVDLANVSELHGGLTLTSWPVELPRASAKLNVDLATSDVVIDLPTATRSVRIWAPKLSLQADALLANKPAGKVALVASCNGRVADLQQLDVSLLDGSARGHGHLDLDQFEKSTAQINWQNLDSAALAQFVPQLNGLAGRMTGSCLIEPASGIMALEPVAMHLRNVWTGGRYQSVRLDNLTLNGYLNHTPAYSRVVLADDPQEQSVLAMAGGTVSLWGRCGVETGGANQLPFASALMQIGFKHLDFDQLLHVIFPQHTPTPGFLSGNLMVLGNSPPPAVAASVVPVINTTPEPIDIFATPPPPTTAPASRHAPRVGTPKTAGPTSRPALAKFLDRFYGEVHATLTDSDLVNLGPFTRIYDLMHLSFGAAAAKPTGYGQVDVRYEADTLSITNMRYFNRGTEIDALATLSDAANIPDSKLRGSAIGSLRPLSQIHLPFFSDVDTLLAVLQQGLTSVTIQGTVRTPKIDPILFNNLGGEMKNYLLGNVEHTNQQQQ